MLSAFREPKNIPISISLLHDIEYKNICLMYSLNFKQIEKRRAFSERSKDKKITLTKSDSSRLSMTPLFR